MTLLVAGNQEGNLYAWDPFPTVAPAGGSLPPLQTITKAHDGEILDMALGYAKPDSTTAAVFTLGKT